PARIEMYCRRARASTPAWSRSEIRSRTASNDSLSPGMLRSTAKKTVTRLDQVAQNSVCAQSEDRLLELRHGIAANDLAKVATLLTRWAVGQLAGYGGKFIRFRQKLPPCPFCPSTA